MSATGRRKLQPLYDSAVKHHQDGQLAKAERLYRDVLAADPDHAPALHHLGLLAHQAGQHAAALSLIDRALGLTPDYAEAHCNRGLVLLALVRADEAVRAIQTAIGLKPNYLEAHYNLGVAHDATGRPAEALASYDAALRLSPGHVDARCNRAIALHALDRRDEAIEVYREVLSVAPHLKRLHTYWGVALLEQGSPGPGIEALRQAMALMPDDPAIPFFLSEIHARAGDFSGAIAFLQQALRCLLARGALATPDVPAPIGNRSIGQFPDALRAVMACMAAAGIEVFLTSGTLLGAIRDGDFISFDKDIDLCVSTRVPIADIHRALATDRDFSTEAALDEAGGIYWTRWRGRLVVDFFRLYEDGVQCWYEFYVGGYHMKWLHKPFELVDMVWHGTTVRIPEHSEPFLEEEYGKAWRIPDPDFPQWACPNLADGFSKTYRYMAHNDLFLSLWRGHSKRARNQCRHALALAPDDAFFRELMHAFEMVVEAGEPGRRPPSLIEAAVERLGGRSDTESAAPH